MTLPVHTLKMTDEVVVDVCFELTPIGHPLALARMLFGDTVALEMLAEATLAFPEARPHLTTPEQMNSGREHGTFSRVRYATDPVWEPESPSQDAGPQSVAS